MHLFARSLLLSSLLVSLSAAAFSATFGINVPVRGTVSDLAYDSTRGKVYVANFSAGRVEVMNTSTNALENPMIVPLPPSAVALSPNGQFLVVGEYDNFGTATAKGGISIINLNSGARQDLVTDNPVLAASFGAGARALVVTTKEFFLVDPTNGVTVTLPPPTTLPGKVLPVPFGTFPPNILTASTGVSGDGQTIIILAGASNNSTVMTYHVGDLSVFVIDFISSPALGPAAVSVNQDASTFLAAWTMLDAQFGNRAQFPYALGDIRIGGHAWDIARNRIYADMPVTAGESPVMHVADTDNLTIRARIKLPQMMAGRSVFSSDGNTLYAMSDGGVMVLPVGSLDFTPQIAALQEDVIFLADACNRLKISKTINIVDLAGGHVDFTLSLPEGLTGITLSATSGTTPAQVRIDVDPTAFQFARGTTTVPLTLAAAAAVNIPTPVRLLINTRDVNQQGTIVNVPGKIVDILSDPSRNRVYMIRQDKNLVLVYDGPTLQKITELRTGNTPMTMAMTTDQRFLIIGNDNSQYASVFDLDTLQASAPILFSGVYPRSIVTANGAIWATARPVDGGPRLFRVDFVNRVADSPASLGVFENNVPDNASLATSPSGNYVLLAIPGVAVAMWDGTVDTWVVSRTDHVPAGGSVGVLGDNVFVVGDKLLDQSLSTVGTLQTTTGGSSGVAALSASGLRTTAASNSGPGTIERVDLVGLTSFNPTLIAEAPLLLSALQSGTDGQIGQTILPFTHTLVVSPDGGSILSLTQSGITVIASDFDAPTPIPSITSVKNAGDGGPGVAPGGLVFIEGVGLAPRFAAATSLPLPSTLGDACVTLSNVALPLFRVSPTEVLAELPFTVVGNSPLIVRTPGGMSNSFTLNVQNFAPAIFRTGDSGDQTDLATVIRLKNDDFVTFTNPIHPDEYLSIYLTGLGTTSPEAPLGDGAPFDPLAIVTSPPIVTLGSANLPVVFAGLGPSEVGVYVINVYVPKGVANAAQTPLTIRQGNASTSLQVRVVNP